MSEIEFCYNRVSHDTFAREYNRNTGDLSRYGRYTYTTKTECARKSPFYIHRNAEGLMHPDVGPYA